MRQNKKTAATLGSILCAFGFHKWKYKFQYWMQIPKEENKRGCVRCCLMQRRMYGYWMKDDLETAIQKKCREI